MRALIPFFVTGRLTAEERLRVEQWLATADHHEAEAQWVRQVAGAVRERALSARDDAGWSRLRHHLAQERAVQAIPRIQAGTPPQLSARLGRWMVDLLTPRYAVAFGVIAVQSAVLLHLLGERSGDTDSERLRSPAATAASLPGPYARILFAAEITEAQLRDFLQQRGLQIVGGPNQLGEYWIASIKPIGPADRWLASIQAAPVVRTAVADDRPPLSGH